MPGDLSGTVAGDDIREIESVYAHAPGNGALGLEGTEEEQEQEQETALAEGVDEEIELGHMQEIVEGLWIGDVVAARDERALREAGIVSRSLALRKPC
jgi:dual specificity phosphatase 12